jgi:hypothetical protein
VAIRSAELRDATVRLDDRAVSPPVQWEVRVERARLRGDALDEPFSVDAEVSLASGGHVALSGSAALDGSIDIVAKLDAVALGPLSPYVADAELSGSVSGEIEARGPAANPDRVRVEVTVADADLEVAGATIVGSLRIDADVEGGIDAPVGAVAVDASAAAVRYGDSFAKPKGVPARLSGRLVSAQGAPPRLTGGKLRLRNLDARIDAELGANPRIVVNAPAFDVAGWQELVPALADIAPSGRVALSELALTTAPLTVRGEIELLDTAAKLPDQGDVVLRGHLVGEGDAIRSRDLQMIAGGQVVAIDLTLTDLAGARRFALRPKTQRADANRLVSSLSSQRDFLYGLLDFEGDLTGSLAAPSPLATLDGRARLAIGDGRLKGISLLKLTLDKLGAVGSVASLFGNVLTAGNLERFYGDDFISITGTFDVRDGVVRTRDLRLVHASYVVDLRGSIGLADRSIDMTGDITLEDDLDTMLAAGLGGSPSGAGGVIPLARVTGTFDDPVVTITPEVAARFALAYGLRIPGLGGVDKALDGVLGRGTAGAVQGVLDGIFGKPKKSR